MMKKLKNILLVGFVSFVSLLNGVEASVNNQGEYVNDYPTYKVGELVKVTLPGTNVSKQFYVGYDYKSDYDNCNDSISVVNGIQLADCDYLYLVEKEPSIKNVTAQQYSTKVNELIHDDNNFYNKLIAIENGIYAYSTIIDYNDIEFICNTNISLSSASKVSCPAWLGYGFWLYAEEPHYDEWGNEDGIMRWAVTMPSLGEDKVNIAAWPNSDDIKKDGKITLEVNKKYVSKVNSEESNNKATTTKNPKTGITNPLFIGGISILAASGLILLAKKKNLFNKI